MATQSIHLVTHLIMLNFWLLTSNKTALALGVWWLVQSWPSGSTFKFYNLMFLSFEILQYDHIDTLWYINNYVPRITRVECNPGPLRTPYHTSLVQSWPSVTMFNLLSSCFRLSRFYSMATLTLCDNINNYVPLTTIDPLLQNINFLRAVSSPFPQDYFQTQWHIFYHHYQILSIFSYSASFV